MKATLEFTDDQLKKFVKEQHSLRWEYALAEYIEHLRYLSREHFEGRADYPGTAVIMGDLIAGNISGKIYIQLKDVVGFPFTPYEIVIKND